MSAVIDGDQAGGPHVLLPLLADADLARCFAWHNGRAISAAEFLADVFALAERLPDARYAVNLCVQRYDFLVAFCAAIVAGHVNLLPASRAPQAIEDVLHAYPNSYAMGDLRLEPLRATYIDVPQVLASRADQAFFSNLAIPSGQLIAIGFTSGSTGTPKANRKTWGSVCASSALNAAALADAGTAWHLLATVPPQHMYGLELSVLLPLRTRATIHTAQPLFPADIANALAQMPEPRVLVTTPFHLRTLCESGVNLPPLAAVVTATAPLSSEQAVLAQEQFATHVIEMFGSTETCVIAHRRTAHEAAWSLYDGVELHPQPDGTLATAPHFVEPTLLQDIVELLPQRRFRLCGRNSDLLEIAGKRASLADLTRRLLAVPGVQDGVVFQLDGDAESANKPGIRRLAALAVAPGLAEAAILTALREAIDPAFLPRPLRLVAALPRNATGKLPRAALLAMLDACATSET